MTYSTLQGSQKTRWPGKGVWHNSPLASGTTLVQLLTVARDSTVFDWKKLMLAKITRIAPCTVYAADSIRNDKIYYIRERERQREREREPEPEPEPEPERERE